MRDPSAGASVPVELGVPPSWHVNIFTDPEALQTLPFRVSVDITLQGMIEELIGHW